jgi:hypothetical protein
MVSGMPTSVRHEAFAKGNCRPLPAARTPRIPMQI